LNACADDPTNVQIFNFIGPFLHDLNNAGLGDIQRIIDSATVFGKSLPKSFTDCAAANDELKALGKEYGVDEGTDLDALKSQIMKYAERHLLKLKGNFSKYILGWIKTADKEWNGGQYEKFGRDAASWGHEILAKVEGFLPIE
jgi:hypothetical protein